MMNERSRPPSATRSSGAFRSIYVPKSVMEAVLPGAHDMLPAQFRDRVPTLGRAAAANSLILRAGFTFLQRFVDDLLKRLQHTDGEEWELWKLLVACYCIEREVGPNALRGVGQKLFANTLRLDAKTVGDAIRGIQLSFQDQHGNMSPTLIGGWQIAREGTGEILVDDATLYPCAYHEGVIAGLCDAFPKSSARYTLVTDPTPKRAGGVATRYAVQFSA